MTGTPAVPAAATGSGGRRNAGHGRPHPWAALDRPGVAIALIALALVLTAGLTGLLEPTEARYAEIAREMRSSGDYLVPRLDGIPHYHKPPPTYWILAASYAILGENEWGARLPTALATVAVLALSVVALRRRFGALTPAGPATWMLGTSALFFALGRSVASDPYLAAAVAGFWALAPSPWALGALGIGFLVKGPVVLVPTVLVVLVAAAWARDRSMLRMLGPAWGWALFAAIGLPWFLIVAARTPGLLSYLVNTQVWQRYTTEVDRRPGPPWYFVGVLLGGALPWTAAFLAGFGRLWRERAAPPARLALCWLLVPLIFFSFSGSKLPAYLLPCFVPVGWMAALGLERGGGVTRAVTAGLLAGFALTGLIVGSFAFGRLVGLEPPRAGMLPWAAIVGLVALGYAATWVARSRPSVAALLVLFGLVSLLTAAVPYEGRLGSARPLARALRESRTPGEPVVEYLRFNAGLAFYLRELVPMLEVQRESGFLDLAREASVFVTRDSIAAWAASHPRVWILGPRGASERLGRSLGLRYQRVAREQREALGFVAR